MKKSQKLISLLLALTMLLSIIPMAMAADGTIVYGGVTLNTEKRPKSYTFLRSNEENAVTKNVGDTGFYQRLPRETCVHTSCGAVLAEFIPDYYSASTTTVELSDPTVLKDLSWTISGWNGNDKYKDIPCLTFNFTAAKPGTTTVKLTFYYNYNHEGESGFCNRCGGWTQYNANRVWWQETTIFTVTVTGEEEKPEYTVTYTDGVENEEVFTDQVYTVKEGDATPAFDGEPTREGYVFLGWEPEVAETVTANATYTATWEEALTEVKVTSSISEGALLYLGSEFKVTATANTDAKLTFNFEANPAFKQIASDATGNSKTVWYRVVKITGNYTKINVSVTGTKGNQEPVTGTLSFGVNLRNRIHVTIKNTAGEIISNVTNIKLNHKYPQWNTCPALKYDAAKQEYVMKNPWDLSSQEFVSVSFDYEGDTYETKVTKDGRNLFDVIRAGEEEIYVEYIVVDPIYVTVEVNGDEVKNEKFKGNAGEKLNYSAPYWEVMNQIQAEDKMATVQILIDNAPGMEAIFGTNKNVKIVITTNG